MANPNPTGYVRRAVSCLLCKGSTTHNNLIQHYDSNRCKSARDEEYGKRIQYCYDHKFDMDVLDTLLEEAGITFDMVGPRKGQYHLARYGDKGSYVLGNCRFIPGIENIRESKRAGRDFGKYVRTAALRKRVSEKMRKRV